MLNDAEKRAAALAVSRFGADRAKVQRAMQAVLKAQARGEAADFLDRLVLHNLLTSEQAQELRESLDATLIDPSAPRNVTEPAGGTSALPADNGPPRRTASRACSATIASCAGWAKAAWV